MSSEPVIVPVVLSGGSGTRLWPASRELEPKQLLDLVTTRTMFQETLTRATGLGNAVAAPLVVCNEAHRFAVAEQARAIGIDPQTIVLEPAGRNTAPALAVAAELAQRTSSPGTEPVLLVLPADHVILNQAAFADAVRIALGAALDDRLVTFGIVPDQPETGYGYLLKGEACGEYYELERFVEKPDAETAEVFVTSGKYLWNSGMFVFRASEYLAELGRHAPGMLEACMAAVEEAEVDADFTRLGREFLSSPADSIDYAVMEKTERAAVVELDAGWSDVGSWSALYDVVEKDADGNAISGDVIAAGCRNSYIASHSRLVAALGLEDIAVIETGDAILVAPLAKSQDVKQIVEQLKGEGRPEVRDPPPRAGED